MTMTCYALLWRSRNKRDGLTEYLICAGCAPLLFHRRADAMQHRKTQYNDIATRPDLRREPHGWMMPRVVKVNIVLAGRRA